MGRHRPAVEKPNEQERAPGFLSVVGLAGSVAGVVLLGAALRTEAPSAERPALAPDPAEIEAALVAAALTDPVEESVVAPPAAAFAVPAPTLPSLALRAAADHERLTASSTEGQGFTAQLALLCDSRRVQELFSRHGELDGLHFLPAHHADRACFRLCWGRYASREEAGSAEDLPGPLRALAGGTPLPRRIDEVLR